MGVPSAHWARIEQLLPQALEIPPPRREEFLRRQCRDEPALLAELVALIRASEQDGDFLGKPVALSAAVTAEDSLPPGTRLGAWQVGEVIGHGGMGQVYAAERADGQFEMSAALKVLKRGLDTDALLQRFLRERQILARLSHPNIARLLDAGATPDGRPYFVMERVQGEPITAYCARTGAGIPEILQLVSQACQAISAAHRERIVHRDLKPSNLLVTAAGELKLLDFGIAKALAENDGQMTLMEARLLTPSYAAPEQILGEPVSVLTDVYALGVILFELLTGQLPHRRDGLPLPLLTAELKHEVTARPSLALLRATEKLPVDPQRRVRELAGDLDHIVLKAMHADPQRRYASAFAFADDLHNYLEHRPVLARPDSLPYRAGRFVRRHPAPVAAGAVATLALIVGFAVALWQARIARAEAQRAQENLATTRAVSDFVTEDLLASVDPDKRSTANITLREMLDTASGKVDTRFADRPEVAAPLHHALGQSYGGLGLMEQKRAHEARAAELFERLYGPDARRTLKARHELGLAIKGTGDLAAALKIQEAVYAGWQRRGEPESPDALVARLEVSSLREAEGGDLQVAIAECRAVMEALERTHGPEDALRLAELMLADNLETSAEYREAETLYRKLLESLARHPANRYLMHPRIQGSLAHVLILRGDYDEAERVLAALRAELTALVPPTHDQFKTLGMYETLLRAEQGRYAEAEAAARRLIESKSLLWTLVGQLNLADILTRAGRAAEGAALGRKVMDQEKELFPPDDSSLVEVSAILAEALRVAGRPRDAAAALAVGVPGIPHLPPRNPLLAHYRRTQGLLLLGEHKPAEARAALAEALSIYETRLGPEHWRTRRVRDELARLPSA